MNYLYPKQIVYLHQRIVAVSGGSGGVRSQHLLESAVYRPQASFGGQDLYPDVFIKAAVLGHSLISNHPFIDGNKRTSLASALVFLRLNGIDCDDPRGKLLEAMLRMAKGELTKEEFARILREL